MPFHFGNFDARNCDETGGMMVWFMQFKFFLLFVS